MPAKDLYSSFLEAKKDIVLYVQFYNARVVTFYVGIPVSKRISSTFIFKCGLNVSTFGSS